MKRFFVMFCILTMIGCSTFGSVKMEDLDNAEQRLLQLSMVVGDNDDLDKAFDLLDKAKKALELQDKIQAEEYEAAALIIIEELEAK